MILSLRSLALPAYFTTRSWQNLKANASNDPVLSGFERETYGKESRKITN
jgi:hypothetical protein